MALIRKKILKEKINETVEWVEAIENKFKEKDNYRKEDIETLNLKIHVIMEYLELEFNYQPELKIIKKID